MVVLRAWCAAVFAVSVSSADAQPDPARVAWLKDHAIPFEFDEAEKGLADLAPLKSWIGDAKIVSLGEPTHGTRECFQLKHRLVEYLVKEMGFTIFAIEASTPEADLLTDYVFGAEGDPKKLIAGMYFWTWDTEEVLAMVEWMRSYNAEMRLAGVDKRIRFTGFDMHTETVAIERARALIAKADPEYTPTSDAAFAKVADSEAAVAGGGTGILVGTFPVEAARGKRITFSGSIRTKGVESFAGLWWRADGPDGTLAFSNMQDQGVRGDTPWTRREFTLDIPEKATGINFGVLVVGAGEAWFDNLSIDLGNTTFRDPDTFDLDFEGDRHRGFTLTTPGARATLDKDTPASGAQSLRLSVPKGVTKSGDVTTMQAFKAASEVLEHMIANQGAYEQRVGARDAAWGIHNARIVTQCMASRALMEGERSLDVDRWNRDASMAANAAWLLDQNPGQRIVLWAHNGHVGRSQMSMGHYLEKRFPGQMIVVGFATGFGRYQAIGDGGLKSHPLLEPAPGSLEWHLDAAGHPRAIFDLRAAKAESVDSGWLCGPVPFRLIGALAMPREQFFPRDVAEEYDLMVWQRDTTRARPLHGTVRGQ